MYWYRMNFNHLMARSSCWRHHLCQRLEARSLSWLWCHVPCWRACFLDLLMVMMISWTDDLSECTIPVINYCSIV